MDITKDSPINLDAGYQIQDKSACFEDGQSDHIEDAQTQELQAEDFNDPRNWPQWKKDINLALLLFHALMTNFVGAGIIPVYTTFAEEFGVSVSQVSYFTSTHILFTGLVPFLIVPFSNRYGRRPVWLTSTFLAAVFNIGCAKSTDYATMLVCRIFCSIFLSAPLALGALVIVESFHKEERSIRMGIWAAMISLGPPLGPFLMSFVAQRAGWQWIYWIFAIISGVQFVLQVFLGSETRYVKGLAIASKSSWIQRTFPFHRIDPSPFVWAEFYRPFEHLRCMSVLIPIYSHSMVFNLVAEMLTVEIPQLFAARFGFGAEQIGLQFIGIIAGTIIAETFNATLLYALRRRYETVRPLNYLVISYFGFLCVIAGLVTFCICLGNTQPMHYNVSPIIGIGIAGFGNQVVANFLVNYVIQMHTDNTSSVSILLGFVRQTWSFIGPFWFPSMFDTLGLKGSAGLLTGLVVLSVLPLIWQHWKTK